MFEYHIDFVGQNKAEQLTQTVISAFGVIGFLVGLILQDIRLSLIIFAAGILVTAILVVPAWPYLKRNPVQWLPSRAKQAAETASSKGKEKKSE
ncbi:hypothetical protein BGZ94_000372 [Podila epigama]|nr:hypothetical protein BGZ94_000372 [Podila epigama]